MDTSIDWTNDKVALSELQPWERNPKKISRSHSKRLLKSWDEMGQFQTIAIGPEGQVYDGHQRLKVLLSAYGPNYRISVMRASRALTEKERERLIIESHVGTTGTFIWENLKSWDNDYLREWGLDNELLSEWKTDLSELKSMLGDDEDSKINYSRKITPPIYEIKGENPNIAELYDDTKTRQLLNAISKSNISDDNKLFLSIAAQRHTILFFNKIAEYYAHADATLKELMENSALVIIDFNKAIENGFVDMTNKMARLVGEDNDD